MKSDTPERSSDYKFLRRKLKGRTQEDKTVRQQVLGQPRLQSKTLPHKHQRNECNDYSFSSVNNVPKIRGLKSSVKESWSLTLS